MNTLTIFCNLSHRLIFLQKLIFWQNHKKRKVAVSFERKIWSASNLRKYMMLNPMTSVTKKQ